MCSRTRRYVTNGDKDIRKARTEDAFDDVDLVVEGKKVKANSSILAYNSSVFSELITDARRYKHVQDAGNVHDVDEMQFFPLPLRRNDEACQVVLPDQNYKNVKNMVTFLQTKTGKHCSLTGEKALKLLPLTEQYKMTRLRKACGNAIYETLTTMRQEHMLGCIPSPDILKYLAAADQYNLGKVRTFCIDECSANFNVTRRKEIAEDKHIFDKTKVTIMDKMCDNMSQNYERKLKQIREDMDKRCREIERKRNDFMEITEAWKNDLKQEVDDMVQFNKQYHKKMIDELEKKKIIDKIDKTVQQHLEELLIETNHLKEQVETVIETMEANEISDETQANDLRNTIEKAHTDNVATIKEIAWTFKSSLVAALRNCETENIQTSLSENYELHEMLDKVSAELDVKIQALSEANINYEEETLEHAKTQAQLRKHMIKSHQINTWLKWAKPIEDDEDKCVCFRHFSSRK